MLYDEDEVVKDGDKGQDDFGQIESTANGKASTSHGEDSSKEIKNDIEDGPSFGALPLEVEVSRRGILDQSDDKFAIAHNCDRIPILIIFCDSCLHI